MAKNKPSQTQEESKADPLDEGFYSNEIDLRRALSALLGVPVHFAKSPRYGEKNADAALARFRAQLPPASEPAAFLILRDSSFYMTPFEDWSDPDAENPLKVAAGWAAEGRLAAAAQLRLMVFARRVNFNAEFSKLRNGGQPLTPAALADYDCEPSFAIGALLAEQSHNYELGVSLAPNYRATLKALIPPLARQNPEQAALWLHDGIGRALAVHQKEGAVSLPKATLPKPITREQRAFEILLERCEKAAKQMEAALRALKQPVDAAALRPQELTAGLKAFAAKAAQMAKSAQSAAAADEEPEEVPLTLVERLFERMGGDQIKARVASFIASAGHLDIEHFAWHMAQGFDGEACSRQPVLAAADVLSALARAAGSGDGEGDNCSATAAGLFGRLADTGLDLLSDPYLESNPFLRARGVLAHDEGGALSGAWCALLTRQLAANGVSLPDAEALLAEAMDGGSRRAYLANSDTGGFERSARAALEAWQLRDAMRGSGDAETAGPAASAQRNSASPADGAPRRKPRSL
jgi:hypothetical protein